MNVTGTAFDSVSPSVTAKVASAGRKAEMSGEAQVMVLVLETLAGAEPMTTLDASLKEQVYDLLTSKPMPDNEMIEAFVMLKICGEYDVTTGTNVNCALEPTFPITAPVIELRTVNKATPCGRSAKAGSWHVNRIEDNTVATGDVTD